MGIKITSSCILRNDKAHFVLDSLQTRQCIITIFHVRALCIRYVVVVVLVLRFVYISFDIQPLWNIFFVKAPVNIYVHVYDQLKLIKNRGERGSPKTSTSKTQLFIPVIYALECNLNLIIFLYSILSTGICFFQTNIIICIWCWFHIKSE